MNITQAAKEEALRRRLAQYAAARDLEMVARENVKAMEAKLAEAKEELSRAGKVLTTAKSRVWRAHVVVDRRPRLIYKPSARMEAINELADVMRDSAEVNQALLVLARESA